MVPQIRTITEVVLVLGKMQCLMDGLAMLYMLVYVVMLEDASIQSRGSGA